MVQYGSGAVTDGKRVELDRLAESVELALR
jgi:hypothetical protein